MPAMALLAATLLLAAVRAAESVAIHDSEPWLVLTENPVGPGALVELSDLVFAGQSVQQETLPVRRLIVESQTGRYDWVYLPCHLSLPQHESVSRVLAFDLGLLVQASSSVQGLADLQGKSVAVWTARLGNLPELEQDPGIAKVEINSFQNGVQMLQGQRVAALVGSNYVMGWTLAQIGADPKQFRFVSVLAMEGCLFANKALPAERRDYIRQRLAVLIKNGTVQQILQRYRGVNLVR